VARELGQLRPTLEAAGRLERVAAELVGAREMLAERDPELHALARAEVERLEAEHAALETQLRRLLVPRDPNDDKNVILEIRAGTGGEEAALFAADLFRMYSRYAEGRGWKLEVLNSSESERGGFRELIAEIAGEGAYGVLKWERGVHRVQRVPETESAGRIHTSTVSVAVLPQAEEVEIVIDPSELRIDVFRSSGPGGQSVNTTDSAVRITHLPTNTVVTCQDEKSQHKNKARALKILRARLLEVEQRRAAEERAGERRAQIGSGDRSEKIRTYNFPQSRVTDHRAGITLHRLEQILEGDLDDLIEGVRSQMEGDQ
jgi:peptide chain release factor 1